MAGRTFRHFRREPVGEVKKRVMGWPLRKCPKSTFVSVSCIHRPISIVFSCWDGSRLVLIFICVSSLLVFFQPDTKRSNIESIAGAKRVVLLSSFTDDACNIYTDIINAGFNRILYSWPTASIHWLFEIAIYLLIFFLGCIIYTLMARRSFRSKRSRSRRNRNHKRGGKWHDPIRRSSKYLPYVSQALCDKETRINRHSKDYPKSRAGRLRHSVLKRACYEKYPGEYLEKNIGFIGPARPPPPHIPINNATLQAAIADTGHYDPMPQKRSHEARYNAWKQGLQAQGKNWRDEEKRIQRESKRRKAERRN